MQDKKEMLKRLEETKKKDEDKHGDNSKMHPDDLKKEMRSSILLKRGTSKQDSFMSMNNKKSGSIDRIG